MSVLFFDYGDGRSRRRPQCYLQNVAHLFLRERLGSRCGIQLGVIVRLLQFLVPRWATYNSCMRLRPAREVRIS